MAVRLRRPASKAVQQLLARASTDPLTYEPVGVSLGGSVPSGFRRKRWSTQLQGPDAFTRAAAAIREWRVQSDSGLDVVADDTLRIGTNVVLTAPLPIGFVDIACRVVALIDEPDRFGFAYGTLPVHPERGEEAFVVERDGEGTTTFFVEAVSQSAYRVGRLLRFVPEVLQDRANRGYLRAIERAASL